MEEQPAAEAPQPAAGHQNPPEVNEQQRAFNSDATAMMEEIARELAELRAERARDMADVRARQERAEQDLEALRLERLMEDREQAERGAHASARPSAARASMLGQPRDLPERSSATTPRYNVAVEGFTKKLDTRGGEPPHLLELEVFKQEMSAYFARTNVALSLVNLCSDKLRALVQARYASQLTRVESFYALSNETLFVYLSKIGAPLDIDDARQLLRSVSSRFRLPEGYALTTENWPALYSPWLVYSKAFLSVYGACEEHAQPGVTPGLYCVFEKRTKSLDYIFLEPLREVAQKLYAHLQEHMSLRKASAATVDDFVEEVTAEMRRQDVQYNSSAFRGFVKLTAPAKKGGPDLHTPRPAWEPRRASPSPGALVNSAQTRQPFSPRRFHELVMRQVTQDEPDLEEPAEFEDGGHEFSGPNVAADRLSRQYPGDDDEEQHFGEDSFYSAQDGRDRDDEDPTPEVPALKAQVIAFHALGNVGTTPKNKQACFSWYNSGGSCAKGTSCEYSHDSSVMEARQQAEHERIKSSPWNVRKPGGPMRSSPQQSGPRGAAGGGGYTAPPYQQRPAQHSAGRGGQY